MLFKIKMLVLLAAGVATVAGQRQKIVKHGDIKVTHYNKDYVNDMKINLYWLNKTTQAFGGFVDLKREVGFQDSANVTVYKLGFNRFGVLYQTELRKRPCEYLAMNSFGVQDLLKRVNIRNCPIKTGLYALDDVIPDLTEYPLHLVPPGTYKIAASVYDGDVLLGDGYWQGQVLVGGR